MTAETISLKQALIDVDDAILVVIDVQSHFLSKLPAGTADRLVNRIGWLVEVANQLQVPVIVTAEDKANLGSVVTEIASKLPEACPVFDKQVFGLAADPAIMTAVRDTGRNTAVLAGLETDVCVAHSALGLQQAGFQVVAVADACASPGTGHDFGLERMRRAGVLLSSVKSLYYEWVRTVAKDNIMTDTFDGETGYPAGISL